MKLKTSLAFAPPSKTPSLFREALNKRHIYLSIWCLLIITLWNTYSVTAAPAKTDSLDSTFPLELSSSHAKRDTAGATIDSYGNPIQSLQPIDTPNGRKVVSAQGLQFEIPNYASGITELQKPTDSLLPPFVAPFSATGSGTTSKSPKVSLSADRESFPPFNNLQTGTTTTVPTKTTFSKSEDGKVITNNVFLSSGFGSTTPRTVSSTQDKSSFSPSSFTGSSSTKTTTAFTGFGSTSAASSGFVPSSTFGQKTTSENNNKYTGRFGGPPGVLLPQNFGFSTVKPSVTKSFSSPDFTNSGRGNNGKFTGSFGGPPGVLKPYDNVKN